MSVSTSQPTNAVAPDSVPPIQGPRLEPSENAAVIPRVIEIRPDGTAIVGTTGLARVLLQPGDQPIHELLPMADAVVCAELFNSCGGHGGRRAVVVSYTDCANE